MKSLVFTDNSLADLESIRNYIALDNPRAAIEFGEGFIKTCELIAQQPEIGVRTGKSDATQRMFTFRGYAIYYRNLDDSVNIQRFLHPSLDHSKQALD